MSADVVMILSACFPALIAYALLKRNLFDLDAVLRAGLVYTLATGFILVIYLALVATAGHFLDEWAGHSMTIACTLVAAALFHPVRLPGPQAVRDLPEEIAALSSLELIAPLKTRGRLIGVLGLGRGVYGYPVLRALGEVSQQLALALENAALVAESTTRERLAALGQLAAVIVHEVKNPLGIIKVAAGTLRARACDDASSTLASCVEDEVDR